MQGGLNYGPAANLEEQAFALLNQAAGVYEGQKYDLARVVAELEQFCKTTGIDPTIAQKFIHGYRSRAALTQLAPTAASTTVPTSSPAIPTFGKPPLSVVPKHRAPNLPQTPVSQFFATQPTTQAAPTTVETTDAVELPIDKFKQGILQVCEEYVGKNRVRFLGDPNEGPRYYQFRLRASDCASVEKLTSERFVKNLLHLAALPKGFYLEEMAGFVELQIPKEAWEPLDIWTHVPQWDESGGRKRLLHRSPADAFVLDMGLNLSGEKVLVKPKFMVVAGATDGGKTNELLAIGTAIHLSYHPKDHWILMIDDPDKRHLREFNGSPFLVGGETIADPVKAVLALEWLVEQIVQRYELFTQAGPSIKKLEHYNALALENQAKRRMQPTLDLFPIETLPFISLMIDELAANLRQASRDRFNEAMDEIASRGIDVGVRGFVATQRPSCLVLDSEIKANFTERLAFQASSENDSKVILGLQSKEGAAAVRLQKNGDAILRYQGQLLHLQTYYVPGDFVTQMVAGMRSNLYAGLQPPTLILKDKNAIPDPPPVAVKAIPPESPEAFFQGSITPAPLENLGHHRAQRALEQLVASNLSTNDDYGELSDDERRYQIMLQKEQEYEAGTITEGEMYFAVYGTDYPSTAAKGTIEGRWLADCRKKAVSLRRQFLS